MAENNVQDQDQIKLPDPIIFTDAASLKVKELIDEEGNPNLKLRVFVQGGGCSGFSTVSLLMKPLTKTTP